MEACLLAIVRLLTAKGEVSAQCLCRLIHASAFNPRKLMDVQLVNSLGLGVESVRAGLHMWHYIPPFALACPIASRMGGDPGHAPSSSRKIH
jgi:hypothetical protein